MLIVGEFIQRRTGTARTPVAAVAALEAWPGKTNRRMCRLLGKISRPGIAALAPPRLYQGVQIPRPTVGDG